LQTLNDLLQKAHDGSTVDRWYYYLATDDYASAPHKKPDGPSEDGTEAPIDKSFKSPFVGKSVADVAEWLKKKPKDVALDPNFFAVLDKKAKEGEGSIVLCRLGNDVLKGDELSCVLKTAEDSSLELGGMEYGRWEELLEDGGEYTPDI